MTLKEFFSKITSPLLWGNFLAMIAVLILIAFGVWKGLSIYTRHGEGVNVPNVKGMQMNDARYELSKQGLEGVVVDSSYNRLLPAGSVIEQSPGVGCKVKSGREIYLTINARHTPTMPVPDIADNSSLREAEAKLKALGFKLGPCEYIEGEKDWVYGIKSRGCNVYAGDRIPIDYPVVLQVGNGTYKDDAYTSGDSVNVSPQTDGEGNEELNIDGFEF